MTKKRGKVFILLLFFSKNFETGKLYTEIVQKRLNEAGITDEEGKPLLEDGIYGEKTKKAHEKAIKIKQFEDENSGVKYGGKSGEKSINEVLDGPGEYEHKVPTTEEMSSYMDNAVLLPIAQEILKNPGSKELQRDFWKMWGPAFLKDEPLSRIMLHHSLQDNPNEFTEKDFNKIGDIIVNDSGFIEWLYKVYEKQKNNGAVNYGGGSRPVFTSSDLKKSIHGLTGINVDGKMIGENKWEFTVAIKDVYDFTEFMWVDRLKEHGTLAVAANDLAYIAQKSGAIQPYDVNVEFTFTVFENEFEQRYKEIIEKKNNKKS